MSKLFGQFSQETLESIASTQFKTIPTKKKDLVSELSAEAENAGVKELVFMLSNMELDDVCNRYLKVEHAPGNNTKAKMVLTKRLMESFEDKGLEDWFEACNDKAVLGALCEKLEISFNPKSSVETSKAAAIKEVRSYGAQILFSRLSLEQLKWCCEEMGLEGWETSNSKRALIAAIITQTAVVKAPAPKQKVITKKKPIEKCTTSDELYQHYSAKALEFWCEQNALKTYGTKKDLINRILEHLSGDKENVVVVPADKLPKVTKGKAAKAKKAVKADDEDMEDAEVVKPSSTRTRGKKPVAKSTDEEPAPKPKAKPVKGKKAAPVEEPADDESAEEPAEEPVKAAPKPKAKPVKGKKATRVEEPADEPVEEPVKEAPKPKAKPVKGKKATRVEEPADEPADDEPADEPVEEPVKEAPKPKAKPVKGKKAAPVVEAPVEEEPADEPADDVYDADAEQRAIDAERALRTNDESEIDIQESESDEQCPKSLEGLIIHLHKSCTFDIAKAAEAIKAAGGTHKASLSRSVNILVTSATNLEKVKKQMTNIPTCRVVDESYLKNIL